MGSRGKGRVATPSLGSARGRAVRNEGAAEVAVLAGDPSGIGTGKVLPKSTTDDNEINELGQPVSLVVADRYETYSCRPAALARRTWVISIWRGIPIWV
jgi:hypothetical protein